MTPFISLDEAKGFLDGGSNPYTGNDALLTLIANGVCEAVEEYIRRPVVAREITDVRDGHGRPDLFLRPRILAVTSVKENGQALAESAYLVRPDQGVITRLSGPYTHGTWSRGAGNVEVIYTAGLAQTAADVPANVKIAALLAFKFFAANGPMDWGSRIEGGAMIKPDSFPRASRFLLDPYVVVNG